MKRTFAVFILGAILCQFSPAAAKSKARAFSYFDDGGKLSQDACDPEKKAPRKMKSHKKFLKFKGYMGSELVETATESAKGVEAWKHYFNSTANCEAALKAETTL